MRRLNECTLEVVARDVGGRDTAALDRRCPDCRVLSTAVTLDESEEARANRHAKWIMQLEGYLLRTDWALADTAAVRVLSNKLGSTKGGDE